MAESDNILTKLQDLMLYLIPETRRGPSDAYDGRFKRRSRFVPPIFGNLLRGLVQPIFVSGQTDHLDRCKPLGRIRSGIAQGRQLALGHQNLNVMLREAEQFRHRHHIKACR